LEFTTMLAHPAVVVRQHGGEFRQRGNRREQVPPAAGQGRNRRRELLDGTVDPGAVAGEVLSADVDQAGQRPLGIGPVWSQRLVEAVDVGEDVVELERGLGVRFAEHRVVRELGARGVGRGQLDVPVADDGGLDQLGDRACGHPLASAVGHRDLHLAAIRREAVHGADLDAEDPDVVALVEPDRSGEVRRQVLRRGASAERDDGTDDDHRQHEDPGKHRGEAPPGHAQSARTAHPTPPEVPGQIGAEPTVTHPMALVRL
jgi:hypothetical protein